MADRKVKLAILDVVGLVYNDATVEEKGLGGSESAVIYMSRELAKLGFEITIFNNCDKPGVYNGVRYVGVNAAWGNTEDFDVVISNRIVLPFAPESYRDRLMNEFFGYNYDWTKNVVLRSKRKIFWSHDITAVGHELLEELCVNGHIDEVLTLSDWHTNYLLNDKRNFEALKNKIFQIRNGVKSRVDRVDIDKKDPDLFVYNASVAKGMIPLLDDVWPLVSSQIPSAKLAIVGGFYRGHTNQVSDLEVLFEEKKRQYEGKSNITFLGLQTQEQIARLLERASFFIYPSLYPETFGIAVTEAINYNVPLIGTRYGALEEIAPDDVSYKINYSLTKGNTSPTAKSDPEQLRRFVEMAVSAYRDKQTLRQKMLNCERYKPLLGWDIVALQLKVHLFRSLGIDVPQAESERNKSNLRGLYSLYGRRNTNREELLELMGGEIKMEKKSITSESLVSNSNLLGIDLNEVKKIRETRDESRMNDLKEALVNRSAVWVDKESVYNKLRLDWIKSKIYGLPRNRKILDAGSWTGYVSSNIYAMGFSDITCLDIAKNVVELGRQTFPFLKWVQGDIEKFETTERFDVILMGEVLEHLLDPIRAIKKMLGYLNEGGVLLFTTPTEEYVFKNAEYEHVSMLNRDILSGLSDDLMVLSERNEKNEKTFEWYAGTITKRFSSSEIEISSEKFFHFNNRLGLNKEFILKLRDRNVSEEDIEKFKEVLKNRKDPHVDDAEGASTYKRVRWTVDLLAREFGGDKTKRILDVGSWTGHVSQVLYNEGYKDITCLDISDETVRMGMLARPHLKWVRADIEKYETQEKYDVILLQELLEHVINPFAVVEKARSMLRPNGVVLFSIPTDDMVYDGGEGDDTFNLEHINKLSSKDISKFSSDFEVLEDKGYKWFVGTARSKNEVKQTAAPSVHQRPVSVLIAFPTAKNIETDTFLSIYRLRIPQGVTTHLEAFYGYNIDQVRNLICYYAIQNRFDYVLFVDSDMILPSDTLERLMAANLDIVTGIYIQRKPGQRITEVHVNGQNVTDPKFFEGRKFVQADSVGFGCILVRTKVLIDVGYPQFVYHDTIDFKDTVSEDAYFCAKARSKGYSVNVMTDLLFEHIASIKLKW